MPSATELAPGELFANRYRIERTVGEGGMGKVYQALDTRLDEVVALKILALSLDNEDYLERFRREVRLARRITHPNVARTHDIGESDGLLFLTMELILGKALDVLLEERAPGIASRKGPFGAEEAVSLMMPMALGLHAAHEAGVVHRDLKPANVMVEGGDNSGRRVVLTDFGVARAVDARTGTSSNVVGTPIYMAPEQIVGDEATPLSDIYSMGMLLYEMLTGHLPFTGATPMAIALARCRVPPTDPREHVDLNEPLVDLVLRCLDAAPSRRPATAHDLASELARFSVVGSARTVIAPRSSVGSATISRPFAPMSPGRQTLAVMPFQFRGPSDLDYLGESLAQELIDALSRTRGLRVLGYGATHTLEAGSTQSLGQRLGADVMVTADVQATADRIRVAARLTEVPTGVQLWSARFDNKFEDVLHMQDTMSQRVADALRVELTLMEHQWRTNAESLELYLRARKLGNHTQAGADIVELLDRCIELSPNFAPAYAARAISAVKAWWADMLGFESSAWQARVRDYVAQAVEHAHDLAETHLAAGIYELQMGEFRATAGHLATALAIAPTLPAAHRYLADLQCEAGRMEEGRRRAQLALELDPSAVPARYCLVRYHGLMGEWDACQRELSHLRESFGTHHTAMLMLRVRMATWEGNLARVTDELRHLLVSEDPVHQLISGFCRYTMGEVDDTTLRGARAYSEAFNNPRFTSLMGQLITEAYASRGETELAVQALAAAADNALVDVAWIERCPLLRDVRQHPDTVVALSKVRNRANAIWEIEAGPAR